ncbi:AraC family transcriptional regulator [Sediminibacillus massiliensis]|uniref:AraC family transcriptional regulator n=1 Tax=Sediminibacillus massiliensis TaxID=1926277 RepID=UPI000988763F|nr:AraC family transcriptional regulator [Sediminibacillus massiliensis]
MKQKTNEKINAHYRLIDKTCRKGDFRYHSHERFEIYFFHGGDCKYLIGDHIYYLQPGDIIIMNGLTLHRANPEAGTCYERSVIEFSSEWVKPILKSLNVPELLQPFYTLGNVLFRGISANERNAIEELIKEIANLDLNSLDENGDKMENRLKEGEVSTLLVHLLFKIYELSKIRLVKIPPARSEKQLHVNRVAKWIDQNFSKDINLDHISDSLNISKYYMSRIFKDVTGYTVMQYLMCCRINRAKYLLEIYPEKTILEVALDSGFESASHFSRYFRKQVKITPTEYRGNKTGQPRTKKRIVHQ